MKRTAGQGGEDTRLREINHLKALSSPKSASSHFVSSTPITGRKSAKFRLLHSVMRMYFIDSEEEKNCTCWWSAYNMYFLTWVNKFTRSHPFFFSCVITFFYLLKIVTVEKHISSKPQSVCKHSCGVLQSYSRLINMREQSAGWNNITVFPCT